MVFIKRVLSAGEELRIARLFSQVPQNDDEHNHAVPVLDVFEDPQDSGISYMVMPLLHHLNEPPFQHVVDAIDFVTQMLEVRPFPRDKSLRAQIMQGLAYMHAKGVAHRYVFLEQDIP